MIWNKNFDYYHEARAYALRTSGAVRVIRTKPRLWRGNGFGYESAEYAVIDANECLVATITWHTCQWRVTGRSDERIGDRLREIATEIATAD